MEMEMMERISYVVLMNGDTSSYILNDAIRRLLADAIGDWTAPVVAGEAKPADP